MPGLNQEFCEILVTCFAHFLWQGLLLGAAFEVLMWMLKNRSPQSRHACGLFCLLIFSLCVPMTYLVVRNSDIPNPESIVSASETDSDLNEMIPFNNEQPSQAPVLSSKPTLIISDNAIATDQPWNFRRAAPLLLGLYFVGVLFFACRLAMGVYIGRSYRQHAMPVTQPEFIASIEKVTRQVGLAIKPPVMWCQQVAVPSVVGILKPTVLLPLACLTKLQPAQLEQILIHELTHIRRYDHLFNLAQNVLEAVLFFHPVVWFISRRVRLEREFCCDAAVVASGNIAEEYANSLIDVAQLSQTMKLRSLPIAVPAVEKPSKLGIRIDRILGRHQQQKSHLFETGSLITVATVLGICCLFAVQLPTVADSNDNKSTTEKSEAVIEVAESPDSINNKVSMNMSEIRAGYLKQVNRINDIEVHYTHGHSSGGHPVMRKWYRLRDYFRHLEDTSRPYHKQKTNQPGNDKSSRLIESGLTYDEKFYYNIRLENGVTKNIQVMDKIDPVHRMSLYPDVMIGVQVIGTHMNLSDLLSKSGAIVVGKVMVGGSECWEVKSSAFESIYGGPELRVHAFLDPAKGFLPRRILVLLDSTDFSNGNRGEWFYDMELDDFKEIKDGQNNQSHWFPSRAIIRQAISNKMTQIVKHVAINQGIDKKIFTPTVQEKIGVLDATTYGEGKIIQVNSQKDFDLFIERLSIEKQIEELKKANPEKTNNKKPTLEFRIAQKESGEGLIETKVEDSGEIIYMCKSAFITDADINFAKVTKANGGSTGVKFELTPEAGKIMRKTTSESIGKRLVVIIEGKVLMAPSIHAPISKSGLISGSFTEKEAKRIVKSIWTKGEDKTIKEKLNTTTEVESIQKVHRKGNSIEFRVIDTEGKPIEGMRFLADGFANFLEEVRGKTNAKGIWIFKNTSKKSQHFQIYRNGYLSHPQASDFSPNDSPVTLKFRKSIPVIGTVVDAESGKPIKKYRLYQGTHFKSNPPEMWSWNQERSGPHVPVKGSWAEGLLDPNSGPMIEPGEFMTDLKSLDRIIKFRIEADGYLPQITGEMDAATLPGKTIKLKFRLKKSAGMERVVLTPEGKPASGARVAFIVRKKDNFRTLRLVNGISAETGFGAASALVHTNSEGRFKFPLLNDQFACAISNKDGFLNIDDINLAKQEKLRLKPWSTVEGTVYYEGKPAAGVTVTGYYFSLVENRNLMHPDIPMVNYHQEVKTDQTGKFKLLKGIPGKWKLFAYYDSIIKNKQELINGKPPLRNDHVAVVVNLAEGERLNQDIGKQLEKPKK